jgi:hypothetical protein
MQGGQFFGSKIFRQQLCVASTDFGLPAIEYCGQMSRRIYGLSNHNTERARMRTSDLIAQKPALSASKLAARAGAVARSMGSTFNYSISEYEGRAAASPSFGWRRTPPLNRRAQQFS